METHLNLNDLTLPYSEWKEKINQVELTTEQRQWLYDWELYDLFNSPIEDEKRKLIRYGHYVGWFDLKNKK